MLITQWYGLNALSPIPRLSTLKLPSLLINLPENHLEPKPSSFICSFNRPNPFAMSYFLTRNLLTVCLNFLISSGIFTLGWTCGYIS